MSLYNVLLVLNTNRNIIIIYNRKSHLLIVPNCPFHNNSLIILGRSLPNNEEMMIILV